MAGVGAIAMRDRRGFTLIELMTVAALSVVVVALVGSLHFAVTRALETEGARGQMLAGAREVMRYVKRDVRQAGSLSAQPASLTLVVQGETVTYRMSGGGVVRRTSRGERVLGAPGLKIAFRPLGTRGVAMTLTGRRVVRSRTLTLRRETAIARRMP
jgi:prepilin-type N-terminal cleavage/methylation domain-containing protein